MTPTQIYWLSLFCVAIGFLGFGFALGWLDGFRRGWGECENAWFDSDDDETITETPDSILDEEVITNA